MCACRSPLSTSGTGSFITFEAKTQLAQPHEQRPFLFVCCPWRPAQSRADFSSSCCCVCLKVPLCHPASTSPCSLCGQHGHFQAVPC